MLRIITFKIGAICMTNLDKLRQAFSEALGMDIALVGDDLQYSSAGWDSIGHMTLVAAIERAFDIMLETEDVIGMSSFIRAKEIIQKHGITIELAG